MPVGDASLRQVVRRELHGNAVACEDADSIAPELAGQMGKNGSVLIELNAENAVRKLFYYGSCNFNAIFFTHSPLS